jgi:hypothetical protein
MERLYLMLNCSRPANKTHTYAAVILSTASTNAQFIGVCKA